MCYVYYIYIAMLLQGFESGFTSIHFDDITCSESHSKLFDCLGRSFHVGHNICNKSNVAGLRCTNIDISVSTESLSIYTTEVSSTLTQSILHVHVDL